VIAAELADSSTSIRNDTIIASSSKDDDVGKLVPMLEGLRATEEEVASHCHRSTIPDNNT